MTSLSLATRDEDLIFSSFVNCIVLATIHAQETGITKEKSKDMPLMSTFGNEFKWSLRDAVSYSGSYDEIVAKNFARVPLTERQQNILNDKGQSQMHSFPGMSI